MIKSLDEGGGREARRRSVRWRGRRLREGVGGGPVRMRGERRGDESRGGR
jgi:hypothetical protein